MVLAILLVISGWELKDSVSIQCRIKESERCYLYLDEVGDSLVTKIPDQGLTQLAQQGIDKAPDWLKWELADNLSRVSSSIQDTVAKVILNTTDPYIDEVCFAAAHLAPQTLSNTYFDPELLLFNAQLLYANDDSLDYVQIVNYSGPDFYSTTKYFVAESTATGIDTFEVELPKEIYYWFIVHPKLHKELPAYIDPNTGNPSPSGYFWRDYLFNHADPGYPLLVDSLKGWKTLWNNRRNNIDNGAVGRVTGWIKAVMEFTTYPHHDQPVRIYHLHKGTCSVHSYLTAGTARACLIPATVTVAYRNNHKWNEFYDRRWVQWEPVNTFMDDTTTYEKWASIGQFRGIFDWRGDGYIWTVTKRYTRHCTLTVNVEDKNGVPIDGARVVIDGPGSPGPRATIGWTDEGGACQFTLGDSVSWFNAQVSTEIGGLPPTVVIHNSEPGAHYKWTATINAEMPKLQISPESAPPDTVYKFEISLKTPAEFLYGTNPDDGCRFGDRQEPGLVDLFICDSADFENYISGNPFSAVLIAEDVSSLDTSFILGTPERWHLVISNEEHVVLTEVSDLMVKLYKVSPGIAEETPKIFPIVLSPIQPNPFKPGLKIRFMIGRERASLSVYDISGRVIRKLVDGRLESGRYSITWDGRDDHGQPVANGVYFIALESSEKRIIRKGVLIR